jgi:hypothetical protein
VKPLALDDLIDIESYELVRHGYRARIIAHKAERRVSVGDRISVVFEDRETLRYQVLEMARVERIRDPARVQYELDVYNELMPGSGELSATLFVEIPELSRIREELDRLVGIHEHLWLVLGDDDDEQLLPASFDERQLEEERISAVHYVRFSLAPPVVERLARGDLLRLRIDHPNYRAEGEVRPEARESLLRDLRDAPPILLDPGALRAARPEGDLLVEGERVRAWRAAPPPREQLVVEPIAPVRSLVEADPALLSELLHTVRRLAAALVERSGGCRVQTDVESGPEARLRFQLLAGSSDAPERHWMGVRPAKPSS